jgi:glucosylceramidase
MTNQTIQWFSTSKAKAWQSQSHHLSKTQEHANLTITGGTHQLFEGFGGCFNELGYVALNHLESDEREQVLHSLFHPEGEQIHNLPTPYWSQ